MLDKNTILNYCRLNIFSKYVHFDMQFLDVKIGALLCLLNGFGIGVPVFSYMNPLYQIVAYQMVQNYLS